MGNKGNKPKLKAVNKETVDNKNADMAKQEALRKVEVFKNVHDVFGALKGLIHANGQIMEIVNQSSQKVVNLAKDQEYLDPLIVHNLVGLMNGLSVASINVMKTQSEITGRLAEMMSVKSFLKIEEVPEEKKLEVEGEVS